MREQRDVPTFTDSNPIELNVHSLRVWHDDVEVEGWEGDTFDLVCCDCGLTHDVAVIRDTSNGAIKICMSRKERNTAQYRRHKSGYLHEGKGLWRLIRND